MYERVELKGGHCPDCGGSEFYEGPSGGACTNICCVGCLSAFNVGPGKFAERIPNTHFVQGGAKPQVERQSAEVEEGKSSWLSWLRSLFA